MTETLIQGAGTALAPSPGGALIRAFVEQGHTRFTGVPCSLLKGAFRELESPAPELAGRFAYVPAPREDSAVGLAVGWSVAGLKPVVLMQNSGLGYCLNVLTSLSLIYDVHVPLVVSWRGHDGNDAVEHDVIGRELTNLLDLFGLCHRILDPVDLDGSVRACLRDSAQGARTSVLIVKDGI
jgi:sulfopyruvate decarboxylase subunit alpha